MKKNIVKKAVSPAWQAKLDGAITVADYNNIISGKVTLEDAIKSHKVTEVKKTRKPRKVSAEKKALNDGKISEADYKNIRAKKTTLKHMEFVKNIIKSYSKKLENAPEFTGDEFDSADNAETAYNEWLSYGIAYNNGYAKWVANNIAKTQEALYC